MNIAEAKEEIIRAATVYLKKDSCGNYVFPENGQRPILLMGPPGIGKSAIVQQAAEECGLGFVSYALTHHTRQSAVGLPHIQKLAIKDTGASDKNNLTYATEYTMSEIIASVYQTMNREDRSEGILFIDEINCVSETLTPVMLQFLQTKTFGTHKVPKGWIIVAAGNPVTYNRSAREMDIVTLDRVRTLDIEPDFPAWERYAETMQVHRSILSYLRLHPDHFYKAAAEASGKIFVTPRGWEDLSMLIYSYEEMGWNINGQQVKEYMSDLKIAESFAAYYAFFVKYKDTYNITKILNGSLDDTSEHTAIEHAENAGLEERLTLTELMISGIQASLRLEKESEKHYRALSHYKNKAMDILQENCSLLPLAEELEQVRKIKSETNTSNKEELEILQIASSGLRKIQNKIQLSFADKSRLQILEESLEMMRLDLSRKAEAAGNNITNAICFLEKANFPQEDLFRFITALSRDKDFMLHVSEYGNDAFIRQAGEVGM